MENVEQMWLEGFVKASNAAGITAPDEVAHLMQITQRLQVRSQHPDEFDKGAEEVLLASGLSKEAIAPLLAGIPLGMKAVGTLGGMLAAKGGVGAGIAGSAGLGKAIGGLGTLAAGGFGLRGAYKGIRGAIDPTYKATQDANKAERAAGKTELQAQQRKRLADAQQRGMVANMTPEQRREHDMKQENTRWDQEFEGAGRRHQQTQRMKQFQGGGGGGGSQGRRWYPSSYGY